jgi:hypothetical protein
MLAKQLVLAMGLFAAVNAKCYTAAEKKLEWQDRNDAINSVRTVCQSFSKDWYLNQDLKRCVQGRTQKYVFWAVRDQDPDKTGRPYYLNPQECYDRFETNIVSCARGGVTNNKNLSFMYVSPT